MNALRLTAFLVLIILMGACSDDTSLNLRLAPADIHGIWHAVSADGQPLPYALVPPEGCSWWKLRELSLSFEKDGRVEWLLEAPLLCDGIPYQTGSFHLEYSVRRKGTIEMATDRVQAARVTATGRMQLEFLYRTDGSGSWLLIVFERGAG